MPDGIYRVPAKVYGTGDFVFALVDEEDAVRVQSRRWGVGPEGYAYRKDVAYRGYDGTRYYVSVLMHRFLMDAESGQFVDHVNGDRLDNRRANLRFCTRTQNLQNRMALPMWRDRTPSSRYKGVSSCKNKTNPWRAHIGIGGRYQHLGCFPTEEDAARAYDNAAKEAYGEFARVNGV